MSDPDYQLPSNCPPPFGRKAEGLSFCLSFFPSFCQSIRPSFGPPIEVGTLWAQHLQFYTHSFETSLVLWSWSEDMHVVSPFGYNPQIIFCHFFRKLNLAIFRALSITMWMDRGYLVGTTPPTVLYRFFWNFTGVFFHSFYESSVFDYNEKLLPESVKNAVWIQIRPDILSGLIWVQTVSKGVVTRNPEWVSASFDAASAVKV